MCVKLLLNLVDCILKLSTDSRGRDLLIEILQTLALKLKSLHLAFPVVCKYYHKKAKSDPKHDDFTALPEYQGFLDLGYCQPIKTSSNPMDANSDLVKGIPPSYNQMYVFC